MAFWRELQAAAASVVMMHLAMLGPGAATLAAFPLHITACLRWFESGFCQKSGTELTQDEMKERVV